VSHSRVSRVPDRRVTPLVLTVDAASTGALSALAIRQRSNSRLSSLAAVGAVTWFAAAVALSVMTPRNATPVARVCELAGVAHAIGCAVILVSSRDRLTAGVAAVTGVVGIAFSTRYVHGARASAVRE
jgi:hypothetical protein